MNKIIFYSVYIILIVLLSYSSFKNWKNLPLTKNDETEIYLISHGWHTGLILKKENLGEELNFLNSIFPESKFFEIGWGDKGFYEAEEITTKLTLQALFLPTESVIHVVSISNSPETYFYNSEIIKISLSKKAHQILTKSILSSFKITNGEVKKTRKGIYGNSFFFEANGKYYITNTCNTWTAKKLEDAGLPFESLFTITSRSIMSQGRDAIKSYPKCKE